MINDHVDIMAAGGKGEDMAVGQKYRVPKKHDW